MAVKKIQHKSESSAIVLDRMMLLKTLKRIRAAVDTRGDTGMEQAQHFIIDGERVIAYNDRISIMDTLEQDTGLGLTVRAEDLLAVVENIQDDAVMLDLQEENLTVSTDTSQAGMRAYGLKGDMEKLIQSLRPNMETDWDKLPPDFSQGLSLCLFAASRDKANVAYHAIRIFPDRMLSTDTWRISRFTFAQKKMFQVPALDLLLPYDAAEQLAKHAVTLFQKGDAWVHFGSADGLIFSARMADAEFPDCDTFLKLEGSEVTLPPALSEAMKAALVFAPGEDEKREAEVSFRKGHFVVKSMNDHGWIERKVLVPGMKKMEELPGLLVNPIFFMDILKRTTTVVIGEDRALFKSEGFEHIMNLPTKG